MNEKNSYSAIINEKMKMAIENPRKIKPSHYIVKILPRVGLTNAERRVRWLRRWWYDANDDIGAFLWLIVAVMVSVMLWLVFAGGLELLKRIYHD